MEKNAGSPAAVDSDGQDMVVEAFFHHAGDLTVHGDLSALQTLQAEQWDGGNAERLRRRQMGVQGTLDNNRVFIGMCVCVCVWSLTTGTVLTEQMVEPDGHPMLDRFG